MVFSSLVFLFVYLPGALAAYFLAPGRFRNLLLLLLSVLFYFWGETLLVGVMLGSTCLDYICGLVIAGAFRRPGQPIACLEPGGARSRSQKAALAASIGGNLTILGFFKYFNFMVGNYNAAVSALGLPDLVWLDPLRVWLPLGISFYTFQSMSYTIDVYRGKAVATRHPIDFACFVTLFPQLVAGPIVRYRDIAAQLVERTVTREGFAEGVRRFIVGLGKKVLIANSVAVAADAVFAVPASDLTAPVAWLGVLCYTAQIYFDFSGYSDMAIGLGRMFGFRFLENFNFPYVATSVQDFWRRWHISLSTWFRDYLYVPLGGSRGAAGRTYANLWVVFVLCGLWHGAAWSFVVWGLYHGLFLVLERLGLSRTISSSWRPFRHVYVMLVVIAGWVLFRADTLPFALSFLGAMVGLGHGSGATHALSWYLNSKVGIALLAGAVGSTPIVGWLAARARHSLSLRWGPGSERVEATVEWAGTLALSTVLFAAMAELSMGSYNPFIYFRF